MDISSMEYVEIFSVLMYFLICFQSRGLRLSLVIKIIFHKGNVILHKCRLVDGAF